MQRLKIILGSIVGILLTMVVAIPAQAIHEPPTGGHRFYLDKGSSAAVNVYSGTDCTGGHRVIQVGHSTTNVGSSRVRKVSRTKLGNQKWVQSASNACIRWYGNGTVHEFTYIMG